MSRFSDEAFNLDELDSPASPLPTGGLAAIDHALRFRRLRERLLPALEDRVLRHLEERAEALDRSTNQGPSLPSRDADPYLREASRDDQ